MRELAGLALSLALPWIAGTLAVAALWRERVQGKGTLCIGYGYLVGALATTLLLRLASLAGWRWSFAGIAGVLIALAAGGWYLAKPLPILRDAPSRCAASLAAMPSTSRRIFWLFLALAAINVVGLACCVAWGLLLPYDAISHWADKARVWYEYGRIMPFVDAYQWRRLADVQYFWDPNPRHPGAVPLLQVWTSLGLGRWDETLMNMPWLAALVALGFAFYAQVRRLGAGAAKAMVCTYLLLSIPLLQINVAVAGMADMFVSVAYGTAAASLWQWTRSRKRQDAALAILMAVYCAMVKNEGILWTLTLVPAALIAVQRRLGFALCGLLGAAAILYLVFGPNAMVFMGYTVVTQLRHVGAPMIEHMFVMDNWHLFWYAAAAVIAVNARRLLDVRLAPLTATVAAGAALVVVVFFFSSAAGGVNEESLVNRFLLQGVPALALYLLAVLQYRDEITLSAGDSARLASVNPAL
ncbi:MAG TPA: hypothetical protein VFF44_06575 [Casimicrobiaceae bacterium]|nr:hypothetical protein [Casimicrobiaceae bacterium]